MQPAIAQRIQKQRPRQPVLEAARGVCGLVLEVQVNALRSKGGQAQWDQVGIGTALVVGFDAGDGFVEPGGVESHGEIFSQVKPGIYERGTRFSKSCCAFH